MESDTSESGTEQETLAEREQEEWRELMEKPEENLTDAEKTSKIKLSIKRRYGAPEWALAFELASPDGRRADAIAVNTFPSRNFKVVGFEFKASRSDWLSEKREGAKSDYFVQACDEWYVVAWSGIVEESELPDGWGLLELKPNSEQLWSQVDSNLPDHLDGDPDRAFWARFVQKTVAGESNFTTQDMKEARKRGYEEGLEDGKERAKTRASRSVQRKAERWENLEDAGIDWLRNLNEDRLREIDAARDLLRRLDEDGFRSIKRSYDDFIEDALEVESSLHRLQSAARDDGSIQSEAERNDRSVDTDTEHGEGQR